MSDKLKRAVLKTLPAAALIFVLSQGHEARAQTAASPTPRHEGHEETATSSPSEAARGLVAFKSPIPDAALLNQGGRRVRFYTDMLKGKVVVLSFFYTTCTFVCDAQGRNLAGLQARLGDRLGREVFLVSVTRDPATDTPRRLRAWARAHGVRDGWSLLTGEVKDVSPIVARFLSDTVGPAESHSATIYVGNEATGAWLTASGLAAPQELLGMIEAVSGRAQLQTVRDR